jgi:hypothetical protein
MKDTFSVKYFLITLLLAAVGAVIAAFDPLLLPLAVAAIAVLGVIWGWGYAVPALAFTCGGLVFCGMVSELQRWTLLAAVVLITVFLIYALKKRLPYRLIAAVLALIALAVLYAVFSLPSLLAGDPPYQLFKDLAEGYAARLAEAGYLSEELSAAAESVPEMYFGMLIMYAELLGCAWLLLTYAFCSFGKAELRPMARFAEWQLPPSLKLGLPVLAGASLILYLVKFYGAPTVFFTVLMLVLPLFWAMGLATLLYLARHRGGSAFYTVLAVLAGLMAPFFMALIGVADLYAGIRRKLMRSDRLIREAFERAEKLHLDRVTVDFGDGRGPQVIAVRKRRHDEAFFDNNTDSAENETNDKTGEGGEEPPRTDPEDINGGEPK